VAEGIPAIAAHRGWHAGGAAENSIAALVLADANGADFAELDIRRLGDGTMVVHHDATLGGMPLQQLDRSTLARHPQVPTLEAWARRAGDLDIGVLAEFKEAGYEADALDVLRRNIRAERLNLMSFDPDAVRALSTLAADRPVGLLSDVSLHGTNPQLLVDEARSAGASFLGLNVRQATEGVLELAHQRGLGAAVWTVDGADDLARLLGDDRITTVISDVPQLAQRIRGGVAAVAGGETGIRLLRAAATMR
jgi:glycerophosphoryl diester phosphodiesterase